MAAGAVGSEGGDRQGRILEAAIDLLAREGIAGVSMRAVARDAGVALGLVNYHFEDKLSLIRAVLYRIEEQDLALVEPDADLAPRDRLLSGLRRFAEPEFLTTEYLSLRLQLWALARVHEDFERINTRAQKRYRARLAQLIGDARPELSRKECNQRDFFFETPELEGAEVESVRYIDDVLQAQDITIVESVQRGMRTPAFEQGRIVYDPAGTGLSEHGVHHFHGLVLDAYRALVQQHAPVLAPAVAASPSG
jgi:AcrR family transcriptional regulator